METQSFYAGIEGRDEVFLTLAPLANEGERVLLSGIGCPRLMVLLEEWRPLLRSKSQDLKACPLPAENDHCSLLLRELLLKARGQWSPPFSPDDEVCHCRRINANNIDRAILTGAHTVEEVSRRTSSTTGCGTCREDVQSLIDYRLSSLQPKAVSE